MTATAISTRAALTGNRLERCCSTPSFTNGRNGLVLSASTFYDDVYHRTNDNAGR
jgi:hypothetical protein